MNDMKHLSQILAIAAVVISISGCKGTRDVVREVPVYLHDTTQVQSVQKDSIYIHDSVNVYMVGDTVKVTKIVTKSVTKMKHDTIYLSTEIPIEEIRTEVREVEKPLSRWQKMQIKGFWWLLVLAALSLIWRTRGWLRKLIVK